MESAIDGSNAVAATAIAQPTTTAIALPLEPLIGFAVLIRWPVLTPSATRNGCTGCGSAHKPFLASRVSFSNPSTVVFLGAYSAPAVFDQRAIDVGAIRQKHIGKSAPVLVEAVSLDGHGLRLLLHRHRLLGAGCGNQSSSGHLVRYQILNTSIFCYVGAGLPRSSQCPPPAHPSEPSRLRPHA